MRIHALVLSTLLGGASLAAAGPALACGGDLPDAGQFRRALQQAVNGDKTGLQFDMWGTIVDVDGTVCAVVFTGNKVTQQWLNSRVISAQKANTANGFSLSGPLPSPVFGGDGLALSTANLYAPTQPGGSLFGLQHSNPVDADVAYAGSFNDFGTTKDPLVGHRVGGINVFGGGLGLYKNGARVGGLGVSGDTSCADHDKAWLTRHTLGLDDFGGKVTGVNEDSSRPDNIIYAPDNTAPTGFEHPVCLNGAVERAAAAALPAVQNPPK
jgi:hypothetical protein